METPPRRPKKRRREESPDESIAHGPSPSIACSSACSTLSGWVTIRKHHSTMSAGSLKTLRLLYGFAKLYDHRLQKKLITPQVYAYFMYLLRLYGCKEVVHPKSLGKIPRVFRHVYLKCTPEISNYSLLLECLDNLENDISEIVWCTYYIVPRHHAKINEHRAVGVSLGTFRLMKDFDKMAFSRKVMKMMLNFRDLVVNRDWTGVGTQISLLPLHRKVGREVNPNLHTYFLNDWKSHHTYMFEIFHIALQRILFHHMPNDITVDAIVHISKQVMSQQIYREIGSPNIVYRPLNYAILIDLCVIGIVYGTHSIETVVSEEMEKRSVRDAEDNFVLQIFSLLLKYEKWSRRKAKSRERALFLADQFDSTLLDLKKTSSTVLIDALIHLYCSVKRPAQLVSSLSTHCKAVPSILGHCFHRVAQLGDQQSADEILQETFSASPDLHPSDPMWVDFVQPRTLSPESFGVAIEIVRRNLDVLFDFLDFGANRRDERAWFLLKSNLESLTLLEEEEKVIWEGTTRGAKKRSPCHSAAGKGKHRFSVAVIRLVKRSRRPKLREDISARAKAIRTVVCPQRLPLRPEFLNGHCYAIELCAAMAGKWVSHVFSNRRRPAGWMDGNTASWKPSKRRDTAAAGEGPSTAGGVAPLSVATAAAPLKTSAQKQIRSRSIEKVFEEASLSGSLNLSDRKLKDFPAMLASKYDITDLIFADVSENRLQEFSVCFNTLYSLESLILKDNCLKVIPSTLIALGQLSYLDLRGNQLRSLPSELFSLPIKILLLTGNRLESLPREIRHSSEHLQELDVSCNRLKSIPSDLALLKNLRVLNLRCNQLVQIPSELCQLDLRILDISSNRLSSLPGEIKSMTLVELRMGDNPLIHPPISVVVKGKEHAFKWLRNQESVGGALRKLTDVNMNRSTGILHASSSLRKVNRSSWETESSREKGFRVFRYNTLGGATDSGYVSTGDERQSTELSSLSSASSNLETLKDEIAEAPLIEEVMNAYAESTAQNVEENANAFPAAPEEEEHCAADFENNNEVCAPQKTEATIEIKKTEVISSKMRIPTPTSTADTRRVVKKPEGRTAMAVPKAVVTPLNRSAATVATVQPMKRAVPESVKQESLVKPKTTNSTASRMGVKPRVPVSGLKKPTTVSLNKTRIAKSTSSSTVSASSTTSSLCSTDTAGSSPPSPVDSMRKILEQRLVAKFPGDENEIAEALSDGVHLCNLANRLRPRSVPNVMTPVGKSRLIPLKCKRNAEGFVSACRKLGVDENHLCSSVDILEKRLHPVARTVIALNKIVAGARTSGGPSLLSTAAANRRRMITNV